MAWVVFRVATDSTNRRFRAAIEARSAVILIPLGPALVALSAGDVATLSAKLVIAFTTTVLGLLVGGACFAMHSVRRHWCMQDLSDIEFVMKKVH